MVLIIKIGELITLKIGRHYYLGIVTHTNKCKSAPYLIRVSDSDGRHYECITDGDDLYDFGTGVKINVNNGG